MKDLIDIHVTHFREGGFWLISGFSHEDRNSDESPEPYGDDPDRDADNRREAIEKAERWADEILSNQEAKDVVIFVKGNEHKCLSLKDYHK